MNISNFLASFFGLYLITISSLLLLRKESLLQSINDLYSQKGSLLIAGIFALFLGIAIVISHPFWVWDWQVIITLLGYIILLKGILLVGFPQVLQHASRRILHSPLIPFYFLFTFALGAFLLYQGLS